MLSPLLLTWNLWQKLQIDASIDDVFDHVDRNHLIISICIHVIDYTIANDCKHQTLNFGNNVTFRVDVMNRKLGYLIDGREVKRGSGDDGLIG